MPITWQVEFQYTSGGSWYDVTTLVNTHTLHRTMTKHNELKPTTNTLDFSMEFDATVINNLLTNSDVEIRVHKDGSDWFTGTVRDNLRVKSVQQVESIQIECVDWSEKLKKRMKWTAALIDYDVLDMTTTANSIIHYLLTQQGDSISVKAGTASIAKTIPYYVNVDAVDDKSYWDAITDLLFQFGYVWDFDESGDLTIYDFLPSSASSTATLDRTNTRESLQIERQRERYDGVEVRWWELGSAVDAVVFRDTTGGGDGYDMYVEVADGDFFPNADGETTYCEYKYGDYEVVYVSSPALNYSPSTLTQNAFTNYFRRAEVELENEVGSTVPVTLFQITGDVVYKEQEHIVRSEDYSTADDRLEIKADHIFAAADAEKLSTGLKLYYSNADFKYEFQSMSALSPGDVVTVADDNLGLSTLCWVLSREDRLLNNDTLIYRYKLEGVAAYAAETPTSVVHYSPPPRTESIEDSDINTGAVGTQASTTPADGEVAVYLGERIAGEGEGLWVKEHNGENWQTRIKAAMRPGGSVADLFVSGFSLVGEKVLTPPGLSWIARPPSPVANITAIAYDGATLVAAGNDGTNDGFWRSTDNGATWSSIVTQAFSTGMRDMISPASGIFIAAGYDGEMFRSTDSGATWGSITAQFSTTDITNLAAGNGYVVAVGLAGKISYSDDNGATWTAVSGSPFGSATLRGVAHAEDTFVVVGVTTGPAGLVGYCADSDPSLWSTSSCDVSGTLAGVDYDPDTMTLVAGSAASDPGKIIRSIDGGLTWQPAATVSAGLFNDIIIDRGVSFAFTAGGDVYRSADAGVTWEQVADDLNDALDVCIGDNHRVIMVTGGDGDSLYTSDWIEAGAGIVEQGSNSKGEYVIFSNGLQVCWGSNTDTTASSTSNRYGSTSGVMYYASATYPFPSDFKGTPKMFANATNAAVGAIAHPSTVSASQFNVIVEFYQASTNINFDWIAIGWAA